MPHAKCSKRSVCSDSLIIEEQFFSDQNFLRLQFRVLDGCGFLTLFFFVHTMFL